MVTAAEVRNNFHADSLKQACYDRHGLVIYLGEPIKVFPRDFVQNVQKDLASDEKTC